MSSAKKSSSIQSLQKGSNSVPIKVPQETAPTQLKVKDKLWFDDVKELTLLSVRFQLEPSRIELRTELNLVYEYITKGYSAINHIIPNCNIRSKTVTPEYPTLTYMLKFFSKDRELYVCSADECDIAVYIAHTSNGLVLEGGIIVSDKVAVIEQFHKQNAGTVYYYKFG